MWRRMPAGKNSTKTILVKKVKKHIVVNGFPSHSYVMSLAIWDHTVLPATRHKWMYYKQKCTNNMWPWDVKYNNHDWQTTIVSHFSNTWNYFTTSKCHCQGTAQARTADKMWTVSMRPIYYVHRVSKKLCKLFQKFVKFRPIVKIFSTKIEKGTSFSEIYSFPTSPNLC